MDFGWSLQQGIAAGNYDKVHWDITAQSFPGGGFGSGQFEIALFSFGRTIRSVDSSDVIELSDSINPWEAGGIKHLLAFGEKYPDEQRKHPIIALGSIANIYGSQVPLLECRDGERWLNLRKYSDVWPDRCRFLAVREVRPVT